VIRCFLNIQELMRLGRLSRPHPQISSPVAFPIPFRFRVHHILYLPRPSPEESVTCNLAVVVIFSMKLYSKNQSANLSM
jgi:hypothetical protein